MDTVNVSSSNSSANLSTWGNFPLKPEAYIVPFMFAIIFIVGVVGNGTLIFTVIKNKNMRNIPNIFLVSLAMGDLLLIFVSVPVSATFYMFNEWTYGSVMCKINESLQTLSLGISVFTLVALSGDRYVAIVHPMSRHRGGSMWRTTGVAAMIWVASALLASLDGISAHTVTSHFDLQLCLTYPVSWGTWYPKFHVVYRFSVYFAMPLLIIASFYMSMARILVLSGKNIPGETPRYGGVRVAATKQTEARKKVARLVLLFVLVFVLCWLPRHVYVFWYHFDHGTFTMFWHVFKIMGFCLSFINSCVNPLALYFLSHQFRRYYNRYIFCWCRPSRPYFSGAEYSEASKMFPLQSGRNSTALSDMDTNRGFIKDT